MTTLNRGVQQVNAHHVMGGVKAFHVVIPTAGVAFNIGGLLTAPITVPQGAIWSLGVQAIGLVFLANSAADVLSVPDRHPLFSVANFTSLPNNGVTLRLANLNNLWATTNLTGGNNLRGIVEQ